MQAGELETKTISSATNVEITTGTSAGNDFTVNTDTLVIEGDTDNITTNSGSPKITLHNTTDEDTDGGRESQIDFRGDQSGGEESSLALIEASHDGTSDDTKGKLKIQVNNGTALTDALILNSDLNIDAFGYIRHDIGTTAIGYTGGESNIFALSYNVNPSNNAIIDSSLGTARIDFTDDTGGEILFKTGVVNTAPTTKMTIDVDGNVGINVAPKNWSTSYPALQIGAGASISTNSTDVYDGPYVASNYYYDGASKYIGDGKATLYYQASGVHYFQRASENTSGAGSALTWLSSMQIDSSGLITSEPTYSNDMNGDTVRDMQVNSSGEFGYDSGSRIELKTNINRTVDSSILYSDEFEPFSFNYKGKQKKTVQKTVKDKDGKDKIINVKVNEYRDDLPASDITEYGFDVREIAKKLPARTNIVYIDESGQPQGINYKKMVPLLVDALRKQHAQINSLINRIESLENKETK